MQVRVKYWCRKERKDGSVDWGKLQYAYEFNYSGSALGNSGTEGPESFQESG